jgi:hypothetical protein
MVSEHSVACRIETLDLELETGRPKDKKKSISSCFCLQKKVCILNSLYSLLLPLQMFPFAIDDPNLKSSTKDRRSQSARSVRSVRLILHIFSSTQHEELH